LAASIEFGLDTDSISTTTVPEMLSPRPSENGILALQEVKKTVSAKKYFMMFLQIAVLAAFPVRRILVLHS
jgi:hypothetical protein